MVSTLKLFKAYRIFYFIADVASWIISFYFYLNGSIAATIAFLFLAVLFIILFAVTHDMIRFIEKEEGKSSMVKWRGKLKVRIVKVFGTDQQNCLVEALENYSKIKKGEQWVTRTENLEMKQ